MVGMGIFSPVFESGGGGGGVFIIAVIRPSPDLGVTHILNHDDSCHPQLSVLY